MNTIKQTLLLLFCTFAISAFGQKMNWKKHLKLADQLYQQAQYADAADHYKKAWQQKSKQTDLIYKAGEAYYILRDYANAADAYQHVKKMNDKYPKVQLRYAQSLKQSGDFDNAQHEFSDFLANYNSADKSAVAAMIQNEIKGCALARQLSNDQASAPVNIAHLSEAINTPETEFAPFPFNDEILYFSSTMAKRAEIYRSKNVNGEWTKAKVPETFPKIEKDHYCNGSLSPDHKRFYFTICKSVENWGGLTTQCNIYVTERKGRNWLPPVKLPDYVNLKGSTTTHPHVVHQGNAEVLYFATNRPKGKGGMDIWYTTRTITSNANDFSYPINAGSKINTAGDEITPHYNVEKEILHFASNGHPSIGGYDIFQSNGSKSFWAPATNIGIPYNSPADDFSFVKSPSGKVGYLVSNRTFSGTKISTTHEDIFSFTTSDDKEIFAQGGVYDKQSGELLTNVVVSIFQIDETGGRRLMMEDLYNDGKYRFVLFPEKEYEIVALKDGFAENSYRFRTDDFYKYEDYGQPLYLDSRGSVSTPTPATTTTPSVNNLKEEVNSMTDVALLEEKIVESTPPAQKAIETVEEIKTDPVVAETSIAEQTITTELPEPTTPAQPQPQPQPQIDVPQTPERTVVSPVVERTNISPSSTPPPTTITAAARTTPIPEGTTYITRGMGPRDNYEIKTSAPRLDGTYYKIQLIAVKSFDINHSRYRPVENMGRLDTEYILDKKLTRVLLSEYRTMQDAKSDLRKVRQFNNYERAFIVKYIDGERYGRVY